MDRYYNHLYERGYQSKIKIILHIDIDSFFVSCERILKPWLTEKPVVIARNRIRGIVTSASYEVRRLAKARAGTLLEDIKTKMGELYIIEPSHDFYEQKSQEFCNFLKTNYCDFIERSSIDEVYLDATNLWESWGHPRLLAKEIQERLLYELKLPATIGIGYSKFSAKMATNLSKPFGLKMILPSNFPLYLNKLSLIEFFGIGAKGAERLAEFGIKQIEDLGKRPYGDTLINTILGKRGNSILVESKGGIGDGVEIIQDPQQEFGQLYTFINGLSNSRFYVINQLAVLIKDVTKRAVAERVVGSSIVVLIRVNKKKAWKARQQRLRVVTIDFEALLSHSVKLLDKIWPSTGVYGIGFKLKNLLPISRLPIQMSLFD